MRELASGLGSLSLTTHCHWMWRTGDLITDQGRSLVEVGGAKNYPFKPTAEERAAKRFAMELLFGMRSARFVRTSAEQTKLEQQFQTELENVFKHLDSNGDGKVTPDEVCTHWCFSLLVLTANEFAQVKRRLRSANVVPGPEVDRTCAGMFEDIKPDDKSYFTLFEWSVLALFSAAVLTTCARTLSGWRISTKCCASSKTGSTGRSSACTRWSA